MSGNGVLKFSPAYPRSAGEAPSRAISVPSWRRARDLSCSALLAGEMCLVVTGLPGTGKTLLVESVARVLRSTGWTIVTFAAQLPPAAELVELTGSAAILIDNADRLSATELRTLNRLRQCSVLLAGAIGLEKRCPADSRVTLRPLPREEIDTYVGLWLEQADLSPDLVTEAAVAHLSDVSAGIPRNLDLLLADALKGVRADGADLIDEHHIDSAAWRHIERKAARRLNRAAPAEAPKQPKPAPARPDPDFAAWLSHAPVTDAPAGEEGGRFGVARALGLIGLGLALGLATAAGVLTAPEWSPWVTAKYASILSKPDEPAPISAAATPAAPPSAAAVAAPVPEQPKMAEVESMPPVIVMPPAPAPAPAPPPAPEEPVLPAAAATPQPEPPAVEPSPIRGAPQNPTPVDVAETLSPAVVNLLYQRGQQMIDLNDYSAARLLFGRAAEAGNVRAMVALGRSYDPSVVGSLASVAGIDPAQAAHWYRKAASLGSADAGILLQQLERGPRE